MCVLCLCLSALYDLYLFTNKILTYTLIKDDRVLQK